MSLTNVWYDYDYDSKGGQRNYPWNELESVSLEECEILHVGPAMDE